MDDFISTVGRLALGLIISSPLMRVDYLSQQSFIDTFNRDHSISIMATVLAINIASAIFLSGQFLAFEFQAKKALFKNYKQEVKMIIYSMLIALILNIISLVVQTSMEAESGWMFYTLRYLSFYLFLFYLYALYEMIRHVFKIQSIFAD